MNAHDFICEKLKTNDNEIIIKCLRDYFSKLKSPDDLQAFESRSFSRAFIMGLIQQLSEGECSTPELRSAYLKVWADCGYFGIDHRKIN